MEPRDLAKFLGLTPQEVEDAWNDAMPFFSKDREGFFSQRLEDYRRHLDLIREKQKRGGKIGYERSVRKKKPSGKPAAAGVDGIPEVDPKVYPGVSSKVQYITSNSTPVCKNEIHAEWVNDYEGAESRSSEAYRKASDGG